MAPTNRGSSRGLRRMVTKREMVGGEAAAALDVKLTVVVDPTRMSRQGFMAVGRRRPCNGQLWFLLFQRMCLFSRYCLCYPCSKSLSSVEPLPPDPILSRVPLALSIVQAYEDEHHNSATSDRNSRYYVVLCPIPTVYGFIDARAGMWIYDLHRRSWK
ncbi:hypothetical protein KP509_31G011600 [Ceratopteris richardii]|uniref:Uncharacterized protein n=1 Tax=Ceratopteris richardii TaxID=49495 RepID=A0A8T2QXE7_CERRI|nr:hypothetical protein KP509_31G011600 [Ceratopteris richardii]